MMTKIKTTRSLDQFDLAAMKEGKAMREHNTLRSTPIKGRRMTGMQRTIPRHKTDTLLFRRGF